ncbi:hypothetical protein [Pseudosporangium ferrugineum]|uniref:Drug/metabolite transporter (DMT)-like permease n=1 Tax=Pseudosporangium ferrugineum TaxID=439699 RepID=A0A2T0RLE6_9ACTN|nr:hypothetical protein [Pseudosporangium ferrugineum]PRY22019.1 hypothetical protein CLV70_11884 [Pseudosporangium ferrugineum]
MTTAGWIALAITVSGALAYGAASILQAVAARRSHGTVETLRHPLYLAGIGCDIFAWVGSMVALRELAVYVVEAVLAGSLAVTVVAARIVLRSHLRRRDVAAVVVVIGALTTLAMSAGPQRDVATSRELRLGFCVAAVTVALLGWAACKKGSPGVTAALGGLCLGGAALTGRALPSGAMDIVTEPLTAALITFAVTGMILYAHALQIGQVGPVTAVHWTAEVVAPSAVALLLLGDTVRADWQLPAMIAGALTIGAAVLLATAPATGAAHQLEAAPERQALPGAPQPAAHRSAERIIWWGPPPIWIPPGRRATAAAALPAPPRAALTWSPPAAEPGWAAPRPSQAGPAELTPPEPVRWTPPEPAQSPVPSAHRGPWHDL